MGKSEKAATVKPKMTGSREDGDGQRRTRAGNSSRGGLEESLRAVRIGSCEECESLVNLC
jgi:hypothetical protein